MRMTLLATGVLFLSTSTTWAQYYSAPQGYGAYYGQGATAPYGYGYGAYNPYAYAARPGYYPAAAAYHPAAYGPRAPYHPYYPLPSPGYAPSANVAYAPGLNPYQAPPVTANQAGVSKAAMAKKLPNAKNGSRVVPVAQEMILPDAVPTHGGPPPVYVETAPPPGTYAEPPSEFLPPQGGAKDTRWWLTGEYLIMRLKDVELPGPLATTDNPNALGGPPFTGVLNSPTATITLDSSVKQDYSQGLRFALGSWLDPLHKFSAEGSVFYIKNDQTLFRQAGDAAGNPAIYIPLFNAFLNVEDAAVISDPALERTGTMAVTFDTNLWGAEFTGTSCITRSGHMNLDLLFGVRYLDLQETLELNVTTNAIIQDDRVRFRDTFEARNHFLGGQIGARARWHYGPFAVDALGKIAAGPNFQTVNRSGSSTRTGVDSPKVGTFPVGLFTQQSNIGELNEENFSVVPHAQFRIALDINKHIQIAVGCEVMYWYNAARAGNQLDRNVNLQQSNAFSPLSNPLEPPGGPLEPRPLFEQSDFWAAGLFGNLTIRW